MKFFLSTATYSLILFNLFACTNVNGEQKEKKDTLLFSYKTASFIQKNDKIKDSTLLIRATVVYPEFVTKNSNKILVDSIKSYIRYSTFGGFATADEFVKDFVNESIAQIKENEGFSMLGWINQDSIAVITNTPTVVSLKTNHYAFTGGAHGNPSSIYTSFDANGKKLTFKDIIDTNKVSSLHRINLAHLKLAKSIDSQTTLEEYGFFTKGDELPLPSSFAITNKGLLMAYNYYEIASYADGVIEYTIPFKELKGILLDKYIPKEE